MPVSRIQYLKNKAKLLQKAKARAGTPIQLKDALEIIAKNASFESWRDLKENLEENQALWWPLGGALWNVWYASYEEALRDLSLKEGQYLLPYQKQFFICDIHYIKNLRIEENDPDLEKVGNNWVEPKDVLAWERLLSKIKARSKAPY